MDELLMETIMAKLSKLILDSYVSGGQSGLTAVTTAIQDHFGHFYAGYNLWKACDTSGVMDSVEYKQTFVCLLAAMSHKDLCAFLQTFVQDENIKLK